MKLPPGLALIAALSLAGCGGKPAASAPATNAPASSASPLSAPADYLGALGKGQQQAIKVVDTASLKQAIQMFNTEQGRNPRDLNELVEEKYLPRLPEAPAGMRLEYDAASGAVRLVKR